MFSSRKPGSTFVMILVIVFMIIALNYQNEQESDAYIRLRPLPEKQMAVFPDRLILDDQSKDDSASEAVKKPDNDGGVDMEKNRVKYGFNFDNLEVIEDTVQSGQSLSDILQAYNVSYNVIHELAQAAKSVFDVRTIRAGKPFCLIGNPNISDGLCSFVYEENSVDYVVFQIDPVVAVRKESKAVEYRTRVEGGVIESCLWDTFADKKIGFDLAIKLADIYAWTIDFHHLQKGDSFKVLYQEKYINDKRAGLGDILSARFTRDGKDLYAFYYQYDGKGDYYDEKGENLRKAFLKSPVKFAKISSGFSRNRLHPILKVRKPHLGTDYAAPVGTPIMSVGDGFVRTRGRNKTKGNYIVIRHNRVYDTEYLHLSKYARGMKHGAVVSQGDIIGYVGATGLATGPHVDFRLWKRGRAVNHLREDLPSAESLDEKYLDDFKLIVHNLKNQIDDTSDIESVKTAAK